MDKISKFTAQLNQVRTTKDGGGRIVFDFGLDALTEIQKIQSWNGTGGMSFALAVVPYKDKENGTRD